MSSLKRDGKASLLLAISGFTVLAVTPFAVLRLFEKDWLIAGLDLLIVCAMALVFAYVYKTHRLTGASYLIATCFVMGMVGTLAINGQNQLFWAFPSTLALYFILPHNRAIIFSSVGLAMLLPISHSMIATTPLVTFAITILSTNVFAYAFARRQSISMDRLIELSQKDPLTGAGNRRALDEKLEELVYLNQRTKLPASILMIDIDKFKNINDLHGHHIGDLALKSLCNLIHYRIRFSDTLFRYGGEEFVITTESTKLSEAQKLAEELRKVISESDIIDDTELTLSIGVAEIALGENRESWLKRADTALYQAKNEGRNKVCVAEYTERGLQDTA